MANSQWLKVSKLKAKDEIAAAKQENLSSMVGIFAAVNSINNEACALELETNTVFSDSESMAGRGQINQ